MTAHIDLTVVDTQGGTELRIDGLKTGVHVTAMNILVAGVAYPCISGDAGPPTVLRPTLGYSLAYAPILPDSATSASLEVSTDDGYVQGFDLTVAPPIYDAQAFALASLLNSDWDAGPRSIAQV